MAKIEICCSGGRLPDHWGDPPNDHVPLFVYSNGNDRLDVQNILSAIKGADVEVAVVFGAEH